MEHLKKMGGGGCSTKGMTQVIELKNKNGGGGYTPRIPPLHHQISKVH